jgi:hypothetical protein
MSDVKVKGQAPVQTTDAEYREAKVSPTGGFATYSEVAPFTTRVITASATVTYIGKAKVGSATSSAIWQVQKMTDSGGTLSILFADGNTLFDNILDNYAGLSYS